MATLTAAHTRGAVRVNFRQHIQRVSYQSFQHAQGDQPAQVHFLQCYARMLRRHAPIDDTARTASPDQLGNRALPRGHMPVPLLQKAAQFKFWWWLLWDIVTSVYSDNPAALPDRTLLDERAGALGATAEMSSFTDEEMTALAAALAIYRDTPASSAWTVHYLASTLWLPNLVRVEIGFQGHGRRYPKRPRTDRGDPHVSRLAQECAKAATSWRPGELTSELYLLTCRVLDEATDSDPTGEADALGTTYRTLVAAYNDNHPEQQVARLHIPWTDLSTAARASVHRNWWPDE